jgi:hypothetical protein
MRQLAESTIADAQSLYNTATANTVRAQFKARGIL